jgi:hypothetical protein
MQLSLISSPIFSKGKSSASCISLRSYAGMARSADMVRPTNDEPWRNHPTWRQHSDNGIKDQQRRATSLCPLRSDIRSNRFNPSVSLLYIDMLWTRRTSCLIPPVGEDLHGHDQVYVTESVRWKMHHEAHLRSEYRHPAKRCQHPPRTSAR